MNHETITLDGTATWLRDGKVHTAPISKSLLNDDIYLADLSREPRRYPGQRNYHGHYWFASTRQQVWHESRLEAASLRRLDYLNDVVAIAAQPMRLQIGSFVHFPDFLALREDGSQVVYDVKPLARVTERVRKQFERTAEVCRAVGWGYRIINELPRQAAVNLDFVSLCRMDHFALDPDTINSITAQVTPIWTINDAVRALDAHPRAVARSYVLHLLWARILFCDLGARLSDNTLIALSPRKEFTNVTV